MYTMEKYLVQKKYDDGSTDVELMSEYEVVDFVNMMDCYNHIIVDYNVYDTSVFGKIIPLYYKGWQPNCLIQFCTEEGNIIISGYGEDH